MYRLHFSSFTSSISRSAVSCLFIFSSVLASYWAICKKWKKKSVVYNKNNPAIFTLILSPSLRWHISIQHRNAGTCHLRVECLTTLLSITCKHLSAIHKCFCLEYCGRWWNMSIRHDNGWNIWPVFYNSYNKTNNGSKLLPVLRLPVL